jgi:hypothetical protein
MPQKRLVAHLVRLCRLLDRRSPVLTSGRECLKSWSTINKGHDILLQLRKPNLCNSIFYAYSKPRGLLIDDILSRSLNDDKYVQSSTDQNH